MKLGTIIRKRFKVFEDLPSEQRDQQKEIVEYINFFSSSHGIDLSNVNIFRFFKDVVATERKLIVNKAEINRIILSMKDSFPRVLTLDAAVKSKIDDYTKNRVNARISSLTQEYESSLESAEKYYAQYSSELSAAHNSFKMISDLEKRENGIADSILKLLEDNFWQYHALRGSNIYFRTAGKIIINKKNPAAGIDITVDLGWLVAELNMQSMDLRVLPYKENLHYHKHYHPHIAASGSVCWGNVSGSAGDALACGNVEKVMTLLASVLITYNTLNPYVPIEKFSSKGVRPKEGTLRVKAVLSDMEIQGAIDSEEDSYSEWAEKQTEFLGIPSSSFIDHAYGGLSGDLSSVEVGGVDYAIRDADVSVITLSASPSYTIQDTNNLEGGI